MDGNRAEKVAAVVVTYNRKDLLKQCLEGILAQTRPVDAIYVIDNASCDGTDRMIAEEYSGRVNYVRLPENTGGAGGFHHGMKLAYEAGYDWIWVMDDDVEPARNCLAMLLDASCRSCGFVAPLVVDPEGQVQWYHHKRFRNRPFTHQKGSYDLQRDVSQCPPRGRVPIEANGFVGPLFNAAAVGDAGLPELGFFLLWDDTEYTYRIRRSRECYLVPDAKVVHKRAACVGGKREGRSFDRRYYYFWRNGILFVRLHDGRWRALLYAICVLGGALWSLVKGRVRPRARHLRHLLVAIADGLLNRRIRV